MVCVHNRELGKLIKQEYTIKDIEVIERFLKRNGAVNFPSLKNGLFPAAIMEKGREYTGYANIWVRDNIHIAHSHYVAGENEIALKNLNTLMVYFAKYQQRFERIINDEVDAQNPMNRPHVRFNGDRLEEIQEKWAHAQNDALGYFVWLYCRLVDDNVILPRKEDLKVLTLFVRYFDAIKYWKDEDSGHWEENRKVSASSIGVVIAALREMRKCVEKSSLTLNFQHNTSVIAVEIIDKLMQEGLNTLYNILPSECIQEDLDKKRRYDAALLFLIYPLGVVSNEIADRILEDVINNLQGKYGVRRYLGDSYWAPDYKKKLPRELRTVDFSDNISSRNELLPEKGLEAQWCIFDSIISVIYGKKYQGHPQESFLRKETEYLNRALGQVTGTDDHVLPLRCPEMYYLEEGNYVPNDYVPLLWAQANLRLSLVEMKKSLSMIVSR